MQSRALGDVSLIAETHAALSERASNFEEPTVLLLRSGGEPLETCDAVQRVLDGNNGTAYAIGTLMDLSDNSANTWQWIAVALDRRCEPTANVAAVQACDKQFPLCTALRRCSVTFPGTRQGLRDAVQHVADAIGDSDLPLRLAIVQARSVRAANTNAPSLVDVDSWRCANVLDSARDARGALVRDNIQAEPPQTVVENATSSVQPEPLQCAACGDNVNETRRSTVTNTLNNAVGRRRREQMAIIAIAGLLVLLFILAIALIVCSAKNDASYEMEQRRLKALAAEAVADRRARAARPLNPPAVYA